MSTSTEKRLMKLANERQRIIERIKKNKREHKGTGDLQARLTDATRRQIAAELRAEKQSAA